MFTIRKHFSVSTHCFAGSFGGLLKCVEISVQSATHQLHTQPLFTRSHYCSFPQHWAESHWSTEFCLLLRGLFFISGVLTPKPLNTSCCQLLLGHNILFHRFSSLWRRRSKPVVLSLIPPCLLHRRCVRTREPLNSCVQAEAALWVCCKTAARSDMRDTWQASVSAMFD